MIFGKKNKIEEVTNGEMLNNMPLKKDPSGDFLLFVWDLLKTGVIVFVIAFSIRYFLIQPFIVEGGSMLPNFIDKEYLLAEKLEYFVGEPKRGDVIIFKYPNNPTTNFIKRVIALPGESIEIQNSQIKIINKEHPQGVILNESAYIPSNVKTLTQTKDKYAKTLGEDEFFVMGDNREHSSDSREWGVLPKANIIGKAWLTLKPFDKFGIHKRVDFTNLSSKELFNSSLSYIKKLIS
ncbi:MAG: Signal peptidase I P [bacterium ADurb.Bin212]|nr:MAG: Signal peptidase I P [bacterium ADurb.Bin212]